MPLCMSALVMSLDLRFYSQFEIRTETNRIACHEENKKTVDEAKLQIALFTGDEL